MENLVSKIEDRVIVKDFGITEAFFIDGEFYLTSEWDIPFELFLKIEKELRSKNL